MSRRRARDTSQGTQEMPVGAVDEHAVAGVVGHVNLSVMRACGILVDRDALDVLKAPDFAARLARLAFIPRLHGAERSARTLVDFPAYVGRDDLLDRLGLRSGRVEKERERC